VNWELFIVVIVLGVTVLTLAALVAMLCRLAFRATRDFAQMHMATDWPSYTGYLMRNEKIILGTGYRTQKPTPDSAASAPSEVYAPDPISKDHQPEAVATF